MCGQWPLLLVCFLLGIGSSIPDSISAFLEEAKMKLDRPAHTFCTLTALLRAQSNLVHLVAKI